MKNESLGIGFPGVLTITFIVLKATGSVLKYKTMSACESYCKKNKCVLVEVVNVFYR